MQAEELVNHMGYEMSENALTLRRTRTLISNATTTVNFAVAKASRQEPAKISYLERVQN